MRHLDVDGLGRVSRIGLGTWQFGSREWGYGEGYAAGAAKEIVRRARDLGVTLFDTAEVYGFGRSERILGEALGDERADVVVASKLFPVAPFPPVVRNRLEGSARRLGLRKVPLYQVHQPNPVVPDTVTMPGLRALLDEDRIGAVGVSNYSLQRWRAADAALGRPVISNQVQFSLARPDALEDLVPFAEREGRVVIAYSPLAQGLLGGRYGVDTGPEVCARPTRCSARRTCAASSRCSTSSARSPTHTASAPGPSPWPGWSPCRRSWSSPVPRAWSRWRPTPRQATSTCVPTSRRR